MRMFRNARRAFVVLGSSALGAFGLGLSASAQAECACMCIEGLSYEVCTGVVTTQAITQACTDSLQCPVDTGETGEETDPDVTAPEGTDTSAVDCRMRNVYRPDLGRYVPHPVCMPAGAVAAHERMKARYREFAEDYEGRHGRQHRLDDDDERPGRWGDGD